VSQGEEALLVLELERAARGEPLSAAAAGLIARRAEASDADFARLMAAAAELRDRRFGRIVTYSPKVFLPLTNICRNRCDYCSFRRSPGDAGAHTMEQTEVLDWLERGRAQGCFEALFCLGDKPDGAFRAYRERLAEIGHGSTVDYLVWGAERALEEGLLPHTNAGVLDRAEMLRLRPLNVSMGLMLECVSPRMCEPGMPHHRAPDKRPERRLAMLEEAGELRIPFTTGILVGIGETLQERVESLLAIEALHRRHGHIQEVIVQNFEPRPEVAMADIEGPRDREMALTVALSRLILDADISLQSPPNLNAGRTALLLSAGINDFGGISPLTPDYINPRHRWPHLGRFADACAAQGFELRPRLPIYRSFVEREGFLDPRLHAAVERAERELSMPQAVNAGARLPLALEGA